MILHVQGLVDNKSSVQDHTDDLEATAETSVESLRLLAKVRLLFATASRAQPHVSASALLDQPCNPTFHEDFPGTTVRFAS